MERKNSGYTRADIFWLIVMMPVGFFLYQFSYGSLLLGGVSILAMSMAPLALVLWLLRVIVHDDL